ncbi:MAG TPA: winged helix-turn-helix domain-containing protein [Casimicrobiaceae bacterium]
MKIRKNGRGLHFPCECVSVQRGYSDPWAAIAQDKLLSDGTKEQVLNSVARRPKTIARLAKELGLSQPTIHAHVNALLKSELLCRAMDWEKQHPAENYYEPNFPVLGAADRAASKPICQAMAEQIADLFEKNQPRLQRAIEETSVMERGWRYADVVQCLYASVQRGARKILEERGVLPLRQRHDNGAEWLFWAEETDSSAKR